MSDRGLIERWPNKYRLYLPQLPGFRLERPTVKALMTGAQLAIADHQSWMQRHELPTPEIHPREIKVFEEAEATNTICGPILHNDLYAPGEALFHLALQVGIASCKDLLTLYAEADDRQKVYKFSPDENSVNETLTDIAMRIVWFSTRLENPRRQDTPVDLPEDPAYALEFSQKVFEVRMRVKYTPGQSQKNSLDDEDWTLRKVLRIQTAYLRYEAFPELLRAVRQRIP